MFFLTGERLRDRTKYGTYFLLKENFGGIIIELVRFLWAIDLLISSLSFSIFNLFNSIFKVENWEPLLIITK